MAGLSVCETLRDAGPLISSRCWEAEQVAQQESWESGPRLAVDDTPSIDPPHPRLLGPWVLKFVEAGV